MKKASPPKKPSDIVSIRKDGGGLLATLRRILQRRKAPSSASMSATRGNPLHPQMSSHAAGAGAEQSRRLSQMISLLSAPKGTAHEPTAAESDKFKRGAALNESEEDEEEDEEDSHDDDEAKSSSTSKSSSKKSGKKKNRWVRQLLNQSEKKKDRAPTLKKRHLPKHPAEAGSKQPPELFTVANELNASLVAKILLFLEIQQPAAVCSYVNKAFADHVHAFYKHHCPHPRPQRYLTKLLFNTPESTVRSSAVRVGSTTIPERILAFLGIAERVNASACCRTLFDAANSLTLTIYGSHNAVRFVECIAEERVEARFSTTTVLELEDMDAECAVDVMKLMDTGETECFAALSELVLRRLRGFSSPSSEALFVQLIQVLFTDRVSRRLETLALSDVGLEDCHLRYLARLLYDARFPVLRRLNLSKNSFSSRFMRDWSRGFANYRFLGLEALDIAEVAMTDEDTQRFVACLKDVPALLRLSVSHNFFSREALAMLGEQIAKGSLRSLVELECSAITADASAMGCFFNSFRGAVGCPQLEKADFSGNPVSNPKASFQLARVFSDSKQSDRCCWPALQHLNLSNMSLGESGFETLAEAIRAAPASTQELVHLDVSGNAIKSAVHSFSRCLLSGSLQKLQFLSLADNGMEALEFELIAHALSQNHCPLLQTLDLSTNAARGEGTARFSMFLRSSATAQKLCALNLSQNEIPHRGLVLLAETLSRGNCLQLQQLNIARNLDLRSVVKFQDMIRSYACPSLVSLQFGYAQTFTEGQAFVKDVLSRMSVEELRRRKQSLFEQRLAAIQRRNADKASRDRARCKRQCQLLRARYDHLESEADRALRRRKKIRKSPHLMIHQEIKQLKQEQYHRALCKALG